MVQFCSIRNAYHFLLQIIFEAGVGKNYQSDIAIDTIHFVEHKSK